MEIHSLEQQVKALRDEQLQAKATEAVTGDVAKMVVAARKRAADRELLRVIHAYGIDEAVAQRLQEQHHREHHDRTHHTATPRVDTVSCNDKLGQDGPDSVENTSKPLPESKKQDSAGHGMLFTPLRPPAEQIKSPDQRSALATMTTPMSPDAGIDGNSFDGSSIGEDGAGVDVEELLLENHRLHMSVAAACAHRLLRVATEF